jgi:hypothetical protein
MRGASAFSARDTRLSCNTTSSREPVNLITKSQKMAARQIEIGPKRPIYGNKTDMAQSTFK